MNVKTLVPGLAALTLGAMIPAETCGEENQRLGTQVIREEERKIASYDWGHFERTLNGDTYGNGRVRMSAGTILPGQWPHPPHQHPREEIIHILSGTGTWHLNGEEIPAHPGDVVFVSSEDWHTLKNTGDTPLDFTVVSLDGPTESEH
jgi:quercetin dioxygenase-like cupin family protein